MAFPGGPGRFRKVREAGRNHFHLSWYLIVPGITSYGQKSGGGFFFTVHGISHREAHRFSLLHVLSQFDVAKSQKPRRRLRCKDSSRLSFEDEICEKPGDCREESCRLLSLYVFSRDFKVRVLTSSCDSGPASLTGGHGPEP